MLDTVSSLSKPLVLVVEDEAALVTMLRYNLEKQGFRVDEATNGEEALTRIAETPPDLVLLDWMLPVVSGIEVCRQIRRRPATRDLPVIMVTARTEDQDAVRALNTGADDYITKPFSLEALLARMRALLRRSSTVPTKGQLVFHDIAMDLGSHRVMRGERRVHLAPPGVLARGTAGRRLGPRHPRRAAHGRCAHPPAAQVDQRRGRTRRGAHGADRGLRAGHRTGVSSVTSPAGAGESLPLGA